MSKHIRTFESFQGKRRNVENETINETVIQRDSSFIVGGIKLDKKTINAYAKKVKDQTGKDLKSMYSEMEIAEELVKWSVNSLDNIDNVPVSALMGGEEEMAQDLDEIEAETELDETGEVEDDNLDLDAEGGEDDLDLDAEGGEDDDLDLDTEGDDDLDLDSDLDDEFEAPEGEEDEDEEGDLDLDEDEEEGEGGEEEDELPI